MNINLDLDSAAVSTLVVILVELTNTVFVNSINITTNIDTAALSKSRLIFKIAQRMTVRDGVAKVTICASFAPYWTLKQGPINP